MKEFQFTACIKTSQCIQLIIVTKSDSPAHCLLRLPHPKATRLSVVLGHFQVTSHVILYPGAENAVMETLGCFFNFYVTMVDFY